MALSIRDAEVSRLARELAKLTGETMTNAIKQALRERLAQYDHTKMVAARRAKLGRLLATLPKLKRVSGLSDDEIVGYDENGLPK